MGWRRPIAAGVLVLASLLAGCQWLMPERSVPGVQPGSTFEAAATPAPTLPILSPSEAPRVSPSLEIPPPID